MAKPIGKTFVEISLDEKKYNKGIVDVKTTTKKKLTEIEKAWKVMGKKSEATYDQMRANVIKNYDTIKKHASSTADDIVRAEKAKNEKIARINKQQFGEQKGWIDKAKQHWLALSAAAVVAIAAIGMAVKRIISTIKEWVNLAKVQELAEINLAAALKASGEYTDALNMKYQAFASSIQNVTKYGDEQVLTLMALMKNLGVTTDKVEEATKMAIGLATATGRGVDSMAMYVALAQQGEFTMLRRYIPALRSTTDATEQMKIITEFAARGFKVAQEQTASFAIGLVQLTNLWSDLKEKLGDFIIKNELVLDLMRKTKEYLIKANEQLSEWYKNNQALINQKTHEIIEALATAVRNVTAAMRALYSMRHVFKEIFFVIPGIKELKLLYEAISKLTEPEWDVRILRHSDFVKAKEDIDKTTDAINKFGMASTAIAHEVASLFDAEIVLAEKLGIEYLRNQKIMQQYLWVKGDIALTTGEIIALYDEEIRAAQRVAEGYEVVRHEIILLGRDSDTVWSDMLNMTKSFASKISDILSGIWEGAGWVFKGGVATIKWLLGLPGGFATAVTNFKTSLENFPAIVTDFEAAIEQLPEVIDMLVDRAPELIEAIISKLPMIFTTIIDAIPRLVTIFLQDIIPAFIAEVPKIVESFLQRVPDIIQAIIQGIPDVIRAIMEAVPDIITTFIENVPLIINSFIEEFIVGIPDIISAFISSIPEIVEAFVKAIADMVIPGGGRATVTGIDIIPDIVPFFGTWFHKGGIIGQTPASVRPFPAAAFANAPRAHTGLKVDERLIVGLTGERVLNRQETKKYEKKTAQEINLTINADVITTEDVDSWLAERMKNLKEYKVGVEYSEVNMKTVGIDI